MVRAAFREFKHFAETQFPQQLSSFINENILVTQTKRRTMGLTLWEIHLFTCLMRRWIPLLCLYAKYEATAKEVSLAQTLESASLALSHRSKIIHQTHRKLSN